MANNKMLIDASHPEETRVAVVRGNRIEEFDFESQAKKQLRGNIYLAKVTRVEPSLQAAFIDYGGNRHGFLAFNEIHPDYYQIPVADRLALLEEEAREASETEDEEDGGRSQRRRGRNRHSGDSSPRSGGQPQSGQASADFDDHEEVAAADAAEDEDGFVEEAEEVTEINPGSGHHSSDNNDGDMKGSGGGSGSGSMAARIESDSISEPAPDNEDDADENNAPAADKEVKPKPRRKPAARKQAATRTSAAKPVATKPSGRKTKAQKAAEAALENASADAENEGMPLAEAETALPGADAGQLAQPEAAQPEKAGERQADRSAARSPRGRGRDRPQGGEGDQEEAVDSVGQEDALEEVPFRRKLRRQYKIQEVIKRRQIMLVQVVKEERGNKGAALTTYLSLAGRYSVLMPNTARGGGISRKITNIVDRKRLKAIAQELEVPKGMGVILRTAGAMRTRAEINRDFEYLMRLWENVRTLTLSSTAPCLVYEEGSLIKRSIRDLYDKDTGEVIVQGEAGFREAKDFMRMLMPSHARNVKPYLEDQAIFSRFGVETQLDRLLTPQVTLKSGGYIVMNQTEALVSIDVNSGRSTREHSIEDTALQTNLEAAEEVARQLRLRDLAGLIVIDFIDMEENRNNRAVEKRLKDALKNDRARIQVGRISHFGLMEMSRQRIRASVMESTMEVCPHCLGLGHVRSHSSIALHVFRAIEDYLTRHPRFDVNVRCPVAIAMDVLNAKRAGLADLEDRFGVKITVHADPSLPGQNFAVEKGEAATGVARKPAESAPLPVDEDDLIDPETDEEVEDAVATPASRGIQDVGESRQGREPREEGDGKRRKRRRRRGGKRNDENGNGQESFVASPGGSFDIDAGEDEAPLGNDSFSVANEAVAPDGGETDPSKRKRRRGRRGGRRNRRDGEEGAAGDNGEAISTSADSAGSTEAEPVASASTSGEEKPALQTAGKTHKFEVTPAVQGVAAESLAIDADEHGAKRGRNTRRRIETEQGTAAVPASQSVSEAPETEAEQPRRSGWWAKGRGFF